MLILLTHIEWELNDSEVVAGDLPKNVLVLGLPAELTFDDLDDGWTERLGDLLSDGFGVLHNGCSITELDLPGSVNVSSLFPTDLGVVWLPE